MFNKVRSIKVSERVFDLVTEELEGLVRNCNAPIDGYLQTFNNCREQGYVLSIGDNYCGERDQRIPDMYIWAFEHRNSDDIEVVYSYEYPHNGMFDDDSYRNRVQHFSCDDYVGTKKYIIEIVKKHLQTNGFVI